MDDDLLLLREVLRGKNDIIKHQKKVIDRLSRKIQRLKRWSLKPRTNEVLLMNESTYWNIIKDYRDSKDKINKAIEYIENQKYLDEDCYYSFKELCQIEDLIKILKGDYHV